MPIKRPISTDEQLLAGVVFVFLYKNSASANLAEHVARVLVNRLRHEQNCKASKQKWGETVPAVIDSFSKASGIKRGDRWPMVMEADGKSMKSEEELNKLQPPFDAQVAMAIDGVAAVMKGAVPSKNAEFIYDVGKTGTKPPKNMVKDVTVSEYVFFAIFPCDPRLPTDVGGEEALLAATIFAEAGQERKVDDERKAIAWATVNRIRHAKAYPADKTYFGDGTMLGALQVKGAYPSYHSDQWLKVAPSDRLEETDYINCLPPDECEAMERALTVAKDVYAAYAGNKAAPSAELGRVVTFNRATNSPPTTRMRKINMRFKSGGAHIGHTFYEFVPGQENPYPPPKPKSPTKPTKAKAGPKKAPKKPGRGKK